MAEPHFLDAERRRKAVVSETNRYQVRFDAPDGITFAPDVTNSHNSFKRIFHVPALPEPKEAMYNFEWDIAKHEGREYVPSSSFVIGDDEELTPAQKFAQETREQAAQTQMKQNDQDQVSTDNTKTKAPSDLKGENPAASHHPDDTAENGIAATDKNSKSDKSNDKMDRMEEDNTNCDTAYYDTEKPEESDKPETEEIARKAKSELESYSNRMVNHDNDKSQEDHGPLTDDVEMSNTAHQNKETSPKDSDVSASQAGQHAQNDGKQSNDLAQRTASRAIDDKEITATDPKEKAKIKAKIKAKAKKNRKKAEKEQANAQSKSSDISQAKEERPITEIGPYHSSAAPAKEENQELNLVNSSEKSSIPNQSEGKLDSLDLPDKSKKSNSVKTEPDTDGTKLEETLGKTGDIDAPKLQDNIENSTAKKPEAEALNTDGDELEIKPVDSHEQGENTEPLKQPGENSKQVETVEPKDDHKTQEKQDEPKKDRVPNDRASVFTKSSTMSKYAPSVSAFSVMADKSLQGKLYNLPSQVQTNLRVKDFKVPPSINSKDDGKKPWNSSTWSSNRAFELLSQQPKGRDSGTQWSEISGPGDSTASISQDVTLDVISALFVPDPRAWRPYRFVRRTNPRQVLLMCAGTALSPPQLRSAEVAHRVAAGLIPREEAAKLLDLPYSASENTKLQAGLGFIYSPDKAICAALHEELDVARVEKNFARRLERPEFPATTTRHRAALRSVIAALEYVRWEEEGFDKIVLATHHGWIIRGISHDIWEWRQNGWRFTRNSVLGLPGENVPDRDLWELLDYVVRQYESIDCNCRFWHIPKATNKEAIALAEMGALKTNQQPSTVRWTKTKKQSSGTV